MNELPEMEAFSKNLFEELDEDKNGTTRTYSNTTQIKFLYFIL